MNTQITETAFEKLSLEMQRLIASLLSDDEAVIHCLVFPTVTNKPLFGKAETYTGLLVVTDHRVIMTKGVSAHRYSTYSPLKENHSIWLEKIVWPHKLIKALFFNSWDLILDCGEKFTTNEEDKSGRNYTGSYPNPWEIDLDSLEVAQRLIAILVKASANASTRTRTPQVQINSDLADQLKKLGELRQANVLTEAEFEAAKRRLIPAEICQYCGGSDHTCQHCGGPMT